jgi:hypothetical protein
VSEFVCVWVSERMSVCVCVCVCVSVCLSGCYQRKSVKVMIGKLRQVQYRTSAHFPRLIAAKIVIEDRNQHRPPPKK